MARSKSGRRRTATRRMGASKRRRARGEKGAKKPTNAEACRMLKGFTREILREFRAAVGNRKRTRAGKARLVRI